MEGFIPVQYLNGKYKMLIVIENTQENKDYVEELLCKMIGIQTTVGKVRIGEAMTKEEALAYNRGFQDCLAATGNPKVFVDGPDVYLDGKKIITGPKKRKNKK